ncbi:MAG: TonB-dependent receptor [Bacteroidales bacterium]|nr:TonB-dependent receptor [Bacteroidales bacterium]
MQNGRRLLSLTIATWAVCATAWADVVVKGTVVDSQGESVIGASVVLKSDRTTGIVTDFDGNFELKVPSENAVLVISYVGMKPVEIKAVSGKRINVTLEEDSEVLEDVVVVGFGQQKKASVVGAITQTTGEVLTRAAGISDISQALTGNLPGVITMSSSGTPGEENTQIIIRGASSWNNSSPLVLVDGVEREMSSVDMQSVQSISVLKDASATAVYGVKGANGVILITTKRGSEGKAQINVTANAIMKIPSKLPGKLDSYDAMRMRNIAIENELNISPDSWSIMKPMSFIQNYRNQGNKRDEFGNLLSERYPNVDWQDALFEDFCMSYNANVNVAGGTRFVKYFASVDFVSEGDIYKDFKSGRGYDTGYDYKRFNMRSNLDFSLTKTTTLKVNLAGSTGIQKTPWTNTVNSDWQISQQWSGIYNIGPDVFVPRYEDGSWGYLPHGTNVTNSAESIAVGGQQQKTTTRINTDFVLEQNLEFITKGLNFRGTVSWDNRFVEGNRGVNDLYTPIQHKWINPETGEVTLKQPYEAYDKFDYSVGKKWTISNGSVEDWSTYRNLYYQMQLNWARQYGKHNVTAMGLFSHTETAYGSMIPTYREDWAFRATYDWATRYFVEYNGAYNGSEKFSKDNRFAFFNSGAIGWMISEEKFMKALKEKKILDMMKIRASYGEIGDDSYNQRWLYMSKWAYVTGDNNAGKTDLHPDGSSSIYNWYREESVGNKDVHWEVVRKLNLGLDYSFLDGLLAGSLEFFQDKRSDIIIGGSQRAVPGYLGVAPSTVNKGKVTTKGYELEVRFNKVLKNQMRIWANASMTHAENKINVKDDAPLLPNYQKQAGFMIGQTKSHLDYGTIQNQDDLYSSTKIQDKDNQRLVGDYRVIDFNGDGKIDDFDSAPTGYGRAPQNTYNLTLGWEWKGWGANIQFYGVTNVTRSVGMTSLSDYNQANVYDQGTWWAQNHNSFDVVTPRINSKPGYYECTQFLYDGSYCRLKNAEISYTFKNEWTKKFGCSNVKLYVSGNNLAVWSKMPDDRESNFSSDGGATGAYPTMRRINFGLKFSL